MVAVKNSLAARTTECPLRESHFLPVPVLRAVLTGVRWIHPDKSSPGACCLEEQKGEEQRPCRVANTFGETMVVSQAVDFQVLHG